MSGAHPAMLATLIEIEPGFLRLHEVEPIVDPVDPMPRGRQLPSRHGAHLGLQPLEPSARGIVAEKDFAGLVLLLQQFQDHGQELLRPEGQTLHDQNLAETVDDQAGEVVGLRPHQPLVGFRGGPAGGRLRKRGGQKRSVPGHARAAGIPPPHDLGPGVVEAHSKGPSAGVNQGHALSGPFPGQGRLDLGGVGPRMARKGPGGRRAALELQRWSGHDGVQTGCPVRSVRRIAKRSMIKVGAKAAKKAETSLPARIPIAWVKRK